MSAGCGEMDAMASDKVRKQHQSFKMSRVVAPYELEEVEGAVIIEEGFLVALVLSRIFRDQLIVGGA